MINFLLRKKLVILVSLVIAFVVGLPHLATPLFLNDARSYSPFSLTTKSSQTEFEEMYAYGSEVQAILRGQFPLNDVHTYEYRNHASPSFGETLPSVLYAVLAVATGSIEKSFIIGDFIFPFLISFLLIEFLKKQTKNAALSILIAIGVIFFWDLIYYLPNVTRTISYLINLSPVNIGRTFNPQLPFLLLVLLLNFLFSCRKPKVFLSGITYGALFYSYIFYWETCTIFLVAWGGYCFLSNKKIAAALPIIKIILIGLVIAAPYLINSLHFSTSKLAEDFILRTTLPITSVIPDFFWRYFIFALSFILIPRKRNQLDWIIFVLMLSSVLMPPISNLLVGRDLETFHYIRRWFYPFSVIAVFLLLSAAVKIIKLPPLYNVKVVLFSISALLLCLVTVNQLNFSYTVKNDHQVSTDRRNIYQWIQNHTLPSSVFGSPEILEELALNSYTGRYIYLPPGDRTLVPTKQNIYRAIHLNKLVGMSSEVTAEVLKDQKKNFKGNERYSSHVLGFQLNTYPKKKIDTLAKDNCVPKARLDFVLISPQFPKNMLDVPYPVAYRSGDFVIYNVSNENTNHISYCSSL